MSTEAPTLNSDMLLSSSHTISANIATTMSPLNAKVGHMKSLNNDSMVIWYHDTKLAACTQHVMELKLFEMFNCVRIITDEEKFKVYLNRTFIVKTLKFIISGEPARTLCSLVEEKSQNYQIYQLDTEHPQAKTKRSNTWSVFNNLEELFKNLYEEQRMNDAIDEDEYMYNNFLPSFGIFNSQSIPKLFHALDKESSTFILFQLLNKILIGMDYNNKDFNDMCDFFRKSYLTDVSHLINIEHFRENFCKSKNAILEYTKDSFLFRLLSKILRSEDTDGIYNARCYIKDLHTQLHILSEERKKSIFSENEIILYRGKKLPRIVLQQLKELYDSEDVKEKLISMNGFLSTTICKRIAKKYADYNGQRDGYESVLFILKIDSAMDTVVPYAYINHISRFPEFECLFSMGSVWQLIKIGCINSKWKVELRLSNHFDDQIANFSQELSADDLLNNCYLFLFAKILCKLGKYSQAVQFYTKLLSNKPSNKFERLIHLNLATTLHKLGLYSNAQEHLDKILELDKLNTKSTNETNSPSLQSIYATTLMPSRLITLNNKGVLYQKNNETEKARRSFQDALEEQGTSTETSVVNNNLGNLENICGNIDEAHRYLEIAVKSAENSIFLHRFKKDLDNVERQLKRREQENQNGTNPSLSE